MPASFVEPRENIAKQRANPAQLVAVRGAQSRKKLFGPLRQGECDPPSIGAVDRANEEPTLDQTIHEPHGAVMLDGQLFGQVSDCGRPRTREPFEGEKRLVLLRRKPCAPCGFFAECREGAQVMAKLGKQPEIRRREGT